MSSYYKGLIAETTARDETTFCHHGRSMVVQCTACEDEEDNR